MATLPIAVFAVYLQRDDLCARGQVFGDLAFVLMLLLVRRLRDGKRVFILLAPLLGAFWVNFHSSFPLGVLVPAICTVGLLFESAEERAPLAPLVVFGVTLGMGTLLNPYGAALLRDVLALAAHPTTLRQPLFMPPDFQRVDTLLTFALAVIALAARRRGRSVLAAPDLLLVALFITAAASAVRYLPHLLYASIVALAPALDSYATELASRSSKRWERAVLPAAALFAATGIFELREPKDVFAHVPIVAANFVKTHPPEGNLLNDYYAGGFLLYVWEGHPKVFIAGRSYLYFNGVFEDAETLARAAPVWRGVITAHLNERFGRRVGWLYAVALYVIATRPTTWSLRDPFTGPNPVLPLAALGGGQVWGTLMRRRKRLVPGMISHAFFLWCVLVLFRLWGRNV